jgi:hypothetical protein
LVQVTAAHFTQMALTVNTFLENIFSSDGANQLFCLKHSKSKKTNFHEPLMRVIFTHNA